MMVTQQFLDLANIDTGVEQQGSSGPRSE